MKIIFADEVGPSPIEHSKALGKTLGEFLRKVNVKFANEIMQAMKLHQRLQQNCGKLFAWNKFFSPIFFNTQDHKICEFITSRILVKIYTTGACL